MQESGISKQDQAANPQAVIDIIGFYTDSQKGKQNDEVWNKFGHNPADTKPLKSSSSSSKQSSKEDRASRDKSTPPPTPATRPVYETPVRMVFVTSACDLVEACALLFLFL